MTANLSPVETPLLRRMLWSKKSQAFLVTGVAAFLLLTFFYCLSVSGYVSRARIDVDVVQTPSTIKSFRSSVSAVRSQAMSSESLRRIAIGAAEAHTSNSLHQMVAEEKFEKRFQLSVAENLTMGRTVVNVEFRGRGSNAEQYMVNALTSEIAKRLMSCGLTPDAVASNNSESAQSGNPSRARQLESSAKALLNQISGDQFSDATLSPPVQHVAAFPSTGSAPFRSVSHTSDLSQPTLAGAAILPSHTQSATPQPAVDQLRSTVGELVAIVDEADISGNWNQPVSFTVEGVSSRSPQPLNGIPQLPQVLTLMLVAGLVASVVTVCYRPFEDAGFESLSTMRAVLGVPVVAALKNTSSKEAASPNSTLNRFGKLATSQPAACWANQVVSVAELFLFAATVIVLGLCVFHTEVRAAFGENLFHGMAKVVWMFRG